MLDDLACPICQNKHGGSCKQTPASDGGFHFQCEVCGSFSITLEALRDYFPADYLRATPIQAAALSHALISGGSPTVTTSWLFRFLENADLPLPDQQADNAIRVVGDHVRSTGSTYKVQPDFYARIGAPNPHQAAHIIEELLGLSILTGRGTWVSAGGGGSTYLYREGNLSLEGWSRYKALGRGQSATNQGFLALKFGDSELDAFAQTIIKPAVKALGFDLIDMRDTARAGLIDNLMREKIRDAPFVLVDLTHDNSGAYWESGYAEGLGKPVLYLCRQDKFDEHSTHFDTNHLTTVTWGGAKSNEAFSEELRATLRRSLNLFEITGA